MQLGKLSFSMFSRFLSINPPEPELLFDVKREHKANSDYPEGYPSLHDFSHNNCFATYQNGILKSPELYYNPWKLINPDRCETVELKTGVWHVTKLTPPTTDDSHSILFTCLSSTFIGLGTKFGVYISKPEGKEFDTVTAIIYNMNETNEKLLFGQHLVEGMNVVDLSGFHERSGFYWRLKVPESFYNRDENGGLLETETDFYVVFFPVLDESQCNGYGEYLIPKFNVQGPGVWTDGHSDIVSPDGLTVDMSGLEHSYYFRYQPQSYYEDDSIVVFSPIFSCFENSANSQVCVSTHGYTSDNTEYVVSYETIGSCNGFNLPYYGSAFLKGEYTSYYSFLTILGTSVVRMLPYNNDRFTVHVSDTTNNYARLMVSETEPFHDKSELQTLICKCKNTLSGSNSMLYKNEVQQPSQKIGLHGIRFATTSETVTDNSFKACLTDGGLATTEARKSIVSYLDGRVLETNDYGDYELLYKDIIMSVVLLKNEITDEDCVDTGSLLFATRDAVNCFSGQLYYLIAFKERLTPWQIAWALSHLV